VDHRGPQKNWEVSCHGAVGRLTENWFGTDKLSKGQQPGLLDVEKATGRNKQKPSPQQNGRRDLDKAWVKTAVLGR